jgi:phosphoribosyl 1,2-cyclic phosphodiesterase
MSSLQTIATGSKGNAYVLTDNKGNQLLLDAGVKRADIVKALNFNIDNLCGCVVTHGHGDHNKAANELKLMGVDVWQPYLDENKRQLHKFKGFSVQSFSVEHDGEPCVGYYIKFNDRKMLYLTDLEYCGYSFANQGITDMLVECNYQKKYLIRDAENYEHKVKGHFSLENCLEFIEHNQSSTLCNIIICHMSSATMDVDECISEIKQVAMPFTDVYAARKGKVIRL